MDAKTRYNNKHYERYALTLSKEKDIALINEIETVSKKENKSKSEVIKQMLYDRKK